MIRKLKHEVRGKPGEIPLDAFVEALRRHLENFRQITIQDDALTAQHDNHLGDAINVRLRIGFAMRQARFSCIDATRAWSSRSSKTASQGAPYESFVWTIRIHFDVNQS